MFEAEGLPGGILFVKAGRSATDEGKIFTSKSGHLLRKWTSGMTVPVMLDYFCHEPAWKQCFYGPRLTGVGETWKADFLKRLARFRPKVIVLIGKELLPIFTKEFSLEKTHCYVLRKNQLSIPIIPCYPLEDVFVPQFGPEADDDIFSTSENDNVACLRQFWIKCAIEKAAKLAASPIGSYPDLIIDNNWVKIKAYLEKATASPKVCLDIETTAEDMSAPDWRLSAFSVSIDSKSAMAITPDIGTANWQLSLAYLRQILASPSIMKVGQNWMGFDQTVLQRKIGATFAGSLWETMSSFSLLFPDFKKGLGEQARMLLDVEPWKGYHNTTGTELRLYAARDTLYTMQLQELHEQLLREFDQLDHFKEFIMPMEPLAFKIQQAGLKVDLDYMLSISTQIQDSLKTVTEELKAFAYGKVAMGERKKETRDPAADRPLTLPANVIFPEVSVIQKMKKPELSALLRNALSFSDKDLKEVYIAKKQDATKYGLVAGGLYRKSYKSETALYERSFNPNSSLQLKSVFAFLNIKLPKVKKSKGVWGESTNVKSLLKLLRDQVVTGASADFIKTLLRFRKLEKLRSVYVEATLDPDNRWRCAYSVSGAGTGRSSSRQTAWKTGGNIQNFPRSAVEGIKIKNLFVADEGRVLVQRDQSQAEARIVAYLAGCAKLIELIETKSDMHVYSMSASLGEDISKYKESDPHKFKYLRNCGKTTNFAGMYGTGFRTLYEIFLKDGVDVSLEQCKFLLEKRREVFPEIYEVFQAEVITELNNTRTLVTPFGRKRKFFGPLDDNTYRKAFAHVPQSTVPYLTNLQWRWLDRYAIDHPEMEIQVLSMIHDALLWQMRPEGVDECRRAFDAYSESVVLDVKGHKISMPWDISVGTTWGSLA